MSNPRSKMVKIRHCCGRPASRPRPPASRSGAGPAAPSQTLASNELEGYALPGSATLSKLGAPTVPSTPSSSSPDQCKCVDFQVLKLPRVSRLCSSWRDAASRQLFLERSLHEVGGAGEPCDIVIGATPHQRRRPRAGEEQGSHGVRMPYLRVIGDHRSKPRDPEEHQGNIVHQEEEEKFRRLAADLLRFTNESKSIAPSITWIRRHHQVEQPAFVWR